MKDISETVEVDGLVWKTCMKLSE